MGEGTEESEDFWEVSLGELAKFSVDRADSGFYWLNPEGKFIQTNKTYQENLGYSKDELKEMHIWNIDQNHSKKDRKKFWKKLKREKTWTFETEHQAKDGETYPVKVTSHYVEFMKRKIEFALAKDIKEQKEADRRKDFLNTLLRQDLGSKYRTIQGYHQLLEKEMDLSEEHREYLRKAIRAGREVDEVLSLAKKLDEIEKIEWITEKDVIKVLEHAIEEISDLIENEGIEIEQSYPETLSNVEGNYSLITLFSETIATRIQVSGTKEIKISAKEKEETVLVTIKDDGKQLPKDMFTGKAYTGETAGVGGVRYYMLQEIAKHNNAKIKAKDSKLGGTRFELYLQKA
ncbi:MAG: Signal transduction histidine kinase containing PAS domain [Candidatus Methanohalarchaeum thermophilum]|uniref:histidine kinase n=1 Tax=Methanohalarchaeum thermophilum TaxID=1903181 RepID=A0A1Q6DRU7_METT1|nr:MAG: Signal transduction histidine kinase containing PAS domain [Candidatus Methanohalarchaeum thermophilum]